MYCYKYNTKIGDIYISADDQYILEISYSEIKNCEYIETQLIIKAYTQIMEYLNKQRQVFDLPLKIEAGPFETDVYNVLNSIEYGKTLSYKDVAVIVNRPKAYRAVGSACNKNKFSIVVPCHRVVSSSGKLTGYAGGLNIKETLLNLEGNTIKNGAL